MIRTGNADANIYVVITYFKIRNSYGLQFVPGIGLGNIASSIEDLKPAYESVYNVTEDQMYEIGKSLRDTMEVHIAKVDNLKTLKDLTLEEAFTVEAQAIGTGKRTTHYLAVDHKIKDMFVFNLGQDILNTLMAKYTN